MSLRGDLTPDDLYNLYCTTPWSAKVSRETFLSALCESALVVATQDGELQGFLRAITDKHTITYVCDIIVREQDRGKGLGRTMMQSLLDQPAIACTTVVALTQVQGFYEKLGFVERAQGCMVRRVG